MMGLSRPSSWTKKVTYFLLSFKISMLYNGLMSASFLVLPLTNPRFSTTTTLVDSHSSIRTISNLDNHRIPWSLSNVYDFKLSSSSRPDDNDPDSAYFQVELGFGTLSLRKPQKSTANSKNPPQKPVSENFLQALVSGTIPLLPLQKSTSSDRTSSPKKIESKSNPAPVNIQKPLTSGKISLRPLQISTASEKSVSTDDSNDSSFQKGLRLGTISLWPLRKTTTSDTNSNIADSKPASGSSPTIFGFGSIPLQSLQKSTANERRPSTIDSTDPEYFPKALGLGTIALRPPQKRLKITDFESAPSVGSGSDYFQNALGLGTISLRPPEISAASSVSTPRSSLKDTVPTLKNWTYYSDGTVTGIIINSQKFRDGTDIKTSPVQGVIESGNVVVSIAGNKYRLQ